MKYLNTRTDMLNMIPENSKFVEIGVFRGEFSRDIINIVKPEELFLVDIWQGKWGSGDKNGDNYVEILDMENVYLNMFHQAIKHNNIHIVRATSTAFLNSCDDCYFDSIYVDGDHEEQAVYNDLVNSYKKIRNGGNLMGHDYHHQIKTSVDRFCADYKQEISYIANDGCPSFLIQVSK